MWVERLRQGDWLDRASVRGYLQLIAIVNLVALIWLIATAQNGIDRNGFLLGTDFLSFWATANLLQQGGNPYDVVAHLAMQREVYAGHDGYTAFFYPPPFLLFLWPLAGLGYFSALVAWLVTTGVAFTLAARAWLGKNSWIAFAAFPPVLITITHGQTSFLTAALLGGGCWLVTRGRSIFGGVLLGLAVFKPQFGLLVPLALLAAGQWRAIAGAAIGALSLASGATLAFGAQMWSDWLAMMGPAQDAMSGGAIGFAKAMSPFAGARLIGVGEGPAYALQAVVTLWVAALVSRAAWRSGFTLEVAAALLAGSLLSTPFVLDYDFTLLAFPLALLANRTALPWERLVAALAFIAPALARPLGLTMGIAIMPLVMMALFLVLIRRTDTKKAP
jgi:hypothetical protein